MILKKNEQIKNSIFNIDGIIEAKYQEGKNIPLIMEKNTNINIKNSNNKNGEINQISLEDNNNNNNELSK